MNDADAASLRHGLGQIGLAGTSDPLEADLIILITCVVRQSAEDRVKGRLSSLRGLQQGKHAPAILVMGCFVHDVRQLQRAYPHVDAFFAPSDVPGVLAWVRDWQAGMQHERPSSGAQAADRVPVTALVPVSYGCDRHCTYCIVRLRRGRQRSRPVEEIVAETQEWAARGARQVVLLGQNVDAYGSDLGPHAPDLADLLETVHEIEGLKRIRFLTSHPAHLTPKLIAAVSLLPRVCPHFELPVQSGDDAVLRCMGRGYSAAEYCDLIQAIRSQVHGCSIATDVIVGFPGEQPAQFQATRQLIESLRLDAVHIAKYSPRPGTPASRLSDDVLPEEKERRRKSLEQLQTTTQAAINAALCGQTVKVLVEEQQRNCWKGRTVTNKLVFFEDNADWRGRLADVTITWTGSWSLRGQLQS